MESLTDNFIDWFKLDELLTWCALAFFYGSKERVSEYLIVTSNWTYDIFFFGPCTVLSVFNFPITVTYFIFVGTNMCCCKKYLLYLVGFRNEKVLDLYFSLLCRNNITLTCTIHIHWEVTNIKLSVKPESFGTTHFDWFWFNTNIIFGTIHWTWYKRYFIALAIGAFNCIHSWVIP